MQIKQSNTPYNETPLVSFIVTYYNLPIDMLCECIDSILALSLSKAEREIIVVDDGSAYCPMNDIMRYGDDITFIRKSNGGVSTARNTGLELASGRFVQFIDGDDFLLQAPYEHCLDIVRFNETDVVAFDFTKRKIGQSNTIDESPTVSGAELMRDNNIHGAIWCYLFRRTIVGSLRFTPGRKYGEDEEFTAQLLLRAENVRQTMAKAYFYRERKESAVHHDDMRSRVERMDDNLEVIFNLQQKASTMPLNESVALRRRIAQLTMDYIYNVIVLTRSQKFVEKKIEELKKHGLFPLPDRGYTLKYKWFRRMVGTSLGRGVLIRTLPLLKRER